MVGESPRAARRGEERVEAAGAGHGAGARPGHRAAHQPAAEARGAGRPGLLLRLQGEDAGAFLVFQLLHESHIFSVFPVSYLRKPLSVCMYVHPFFVYVRSSVRPFVMC